MSDRRPADDGAAGGPVGPGLALFFATTGFFALLICGLGIASLVLDADVIAVRGLGPIPGITGTVAASLTFAVSLWTVVRRRHPSFWNAGWIGLATVAAYSAGIWIAVVAGGSGPAIATGVVGRLATTWFGVVVVAAAFVPAWAGIALVRTRARRPRWPWEGDDED